MGRPQGRLGGGWGRPGTEHARALGRFKVLVAVVLWGASFVATKAALAEIRPVTLITLRFAVGVAVLAAVVARRRAFRRIAGRDLSLLALLGAIGIPIHQGLQANGLLFTSATSMSWLVALIPIFSALLARIFLSESFGPGKILGLAIAFAGALLVVTRGVFNLEVIHLPSTTGDALALASALNWAIFSIASKPLLERLPPALTTAYFMFLGWLMVVPFFLAADGWRDLTRLSATGWTAVAFLGLLCSGLAYVFWNDALAIIDASEAASFIYLEPLVTVAVAAVLAGEAITLPALLGGSTILLGVVLVNRPDRRRRANRRALGRRDGNESPGARSDSTGSDSSESSLPGGS